MGAAEAGFERSRSNSSTTLMPGSNSQSQSQMNGHDVVTVEPSPVANKKSKTSSKTEATAFAELNMLSRRYFLAYLSNTFTDEPVRTVFPGMKSDHRVYKDGKFRVQRSYKTWKAEVLKSALQWVQRWIKSARSGRQVFLSGLSAFADIKAELRKEYEHKWLESVFRFGIDAVDFETISSEGLRFLKCESTTTSCTCGRLLQMQSIANLRTFRLLFAACHAFPPD